MAEHPQPPPSPDVPPIDPALGVGLTILTLLLVGLGLGGLALPDTPRALAWAANLMLVVGNIAGCWLHVRMRGGLPLRWLTTAAIGLAVASAVGPAMYARAGLLLSGSATVGILLEAWRRPIDALVALSAIGSALLGHGVLYWAATMGGSAPFQFLRITLLFGGAGSLMVGTSSALVWCRQHTRRDAPAIAQPSWIQPAAWSGMLVALICATLVAVLVDRAPALVPATWVLAAIANVGALTYQLAATLTFWRND